MDEATNDNEWVSGDVEMNNYSLLFAWNATLSAAANDVGFFNISDMDASTDKDYIFDRLEIRAVFITLYTIVFCCCFFGNLLVILVVTLSRRLRSITNFFLANLAVADLCVGLFCVFQNLSMYLIPSWVFGNFLCKMYWFAHSLSYTASIFILVVICTERYFAIIHPITCKQMLTYTRLRIVIFGVWVLSAAYSVPKFIWVQTITVNITDGGSETICITHRKKYNSELFDMINFGLLYVIPLTVMTVLYTRIAVGLWRSSRQLEKHLNAIGTCAGLTATASSNVASNGDTSHRQPTASPRYADRTVAVTPDSESSAQTDKPTTTWSRSIPGGGDHAASSSSRLLQTPLASGAATRSASPAASTRHSHHQQTATASTSCHGTNSAQNVLRARRGVVRMLIVVVLTFALCNLPYHARKMWQYWSDDYKGDSNFSSLFTPLTFLVTYFNSGINPLLYAFLSRNFRKGMRELLMCSFRNTKKNKGKRYSNKHNYPLSHSSFLRRGGSTRSTVKGNNTTTTSIR